MVYRHWLAPWVTGAMLVVAGSAMAHAEDAPAEAWTTQRTLSPGEVVQASDVAIDKIPNPMFGLFSVDRSPAGLEVKRRVISGRPLMERDVGRHALVKANAQVHILWRAGAIAMDMEGRSLQEGAAGDQIRVLNTSSSRTLHGVVLPDGTIQVGSSE